MVYWEYHVVCIEVDVENPDFYIEDLNELGEEKWELVSINGTVHIFKRPRF